MEKRNLFHFSAFQGWNYWFLNVDRCAVKTIALKFLSLSLRLTQMPLLNSLWWCQRDSERGWALCPLRWRKRCFEDDFWREILPECEGSDSQPFKIVGDSRHSSIPRHSEAFWRTDCGKTRNFIVFLRQIKLKKIWKLRNQCFLTFSQTIYCLLAILEVFFELYDQLNAELFDFMCRSTDFEKLNIFALFQKRGKS